MSPSHSSNPARLPRRPFGRSGIELSIIGFGGIVVCGKEQSHANRIVAESVECGVNYFDVAPSYDDAEAKLGPALEPYRKNCFLACKTTERTAAGAANELRASLERMRTDSFDLYQLHALTKLREDVDAVFAKGGAMETFIAAKKEGRIRHIGFSAHSVEAAMAAMDRYDFDSVLFPVNFATFHEGEFGPQIIAKAKERGVARLALKALAKGRWEDNDPEKARWPECWYKPVSDPREADLALRWTLSQDITAAIPPGNLELYEMALHIAERFTPATADEEERVIAMAQAIRPLFAKA